VNVAVIGPGAPRARDLLGALMAAGYACRGFTRAQTCEQSAQDWDAVLLLQPGAPKDVAESAALRRLASKVPLLIASGQIDLDTVRYAATVGAQDVVLRGEPFRVIESLSRAVTRRGGVLAAGVSDAVLIDLVRRVFDLTPNYVSIRDDRGNYVVVSQSYADLYGTTVEEMNGKPVAAFLRSGEAIEREAAEDRDVLQLRRSRTAIQDVVDSSGTQRQLQIVKRPITLDDGRTYVMCVAVDITKNQRAESALSKTNEFLRNILETISDGVFALDLSGKLTLANNRLCQMTGYRHHELIGMPFSRIFSGDTGIDVARVIQGLATEGNKERRFEAHVAHADGHQKIITCSLLPLRQGERIVGIAGTALDITERKAAEQRIEHLAYHDPLTNLPNRRLLNDRLTMAMSQAQRDGRMVGVLFVDLDRFKSINDSLGHRTGDAVLAELGTRLRALVRSGDTVARMGGDEFVFLLPAMDRVDEAVSVARNVLEMVRRPFEIDGREFVVTASIGISIYPKHASDADTLIKQADTALFECKRRSSDAYELFDESMSTRSMDYFILENDLRRAIALDELLLMFQPIVEMRTERMIALEALVRWNHPQRGLLMPEQFIQVAEETGLVVPLGDWVMRAACRQNLEWQRRGLFLVPVAVNVSALQLDADLAASVAQALDESSLPGQYLELELTETILMETAASSSTALDALKEMGVRISIDDFGTGYSSLSYLQRFPIDALKIDRSFMPHEPADPGAGIIATTIISMAQSLGLQVIAEGVETREQRDFLLARGCTRAQGHYYWEAMTPQALEALVGSDSRDNILA
jgi:diguanylate cyclase (GGDEF)-like protein/PAS domain S-box-containing protein